MSTVDEHIHESVDDELTVPRAAALLGISPTSMRQLLNSGKIAFTRPLKQPRIRRGDVLAYRAMRHRDAGRRLPRLDMSVWD